MTSDESTAAVVGITNWWFIPVSNTLFVEGANVAPDGCIFYVLAVVT